MVTIDIHMSDSDTEYVALHCKKLLLFTANLTLNIQYLLLSENVQ